ncbi:MAG: RloB domain-containing protein [Clostridia bacterium]|nr:RloB domain-containing protein [Clostridia bacterium]
MTKRNGYQPKPRNTNQRQRKKIILLATEGKNKTETHYFRSLSGSSYIIRFAPGNYTDPVNLVHALKTEFEDQGLETEMGDVAYCLIDSDLDPTKDIQIENAEIKAGDVATVIVSSPCFEIWYLCHYVKSTRQFSSNKEVIDTLKRYIPEYNKSMTGIWSILGDKSNDAIKNAKELERHCLELGLKPHTVAFMPSTEIYKIVSIILNE